MLPLAVILASVYLAWSDEPLWESDIANLSPLSKEKRILDQTLRHELGAPDVRELMIIEAPTEQEVLQRSEMALERFGVATRRGVLLLGDPGNGKTMACRWLFSQCCRSGLEWSNVTAAMYEDARAEREVPGLFRLDGPGIILFDDFENRVLLAGAELPAATALSRRLRGLLREIGSEIAEGISVRTLHKAP